MATPVASAVLGREVELGMLDGFASAPWPAALRIEGVAGIGKTALWSATVERLAALGVDIWLCRAVEAERSIAYAALDVLLRPRLERLDHLPPARREAIEILLGIKDPIHELGVRSAGLAVTDLLTSASTERPVLIAIDDIQWVDEATSAVLAFGLRRVAGRPVSLLSTCRPPCAPSLEEAITPNSKVVHLGPLTVGAVGRMLSDRLDVHLSRAQLTQLHERSGGNPLTALELGRALGSRSTIGAGQTELLQGRVAKLDTGTRTLLAVMGMLGEPDLDTVQRVLGTAQPLRELIAEAVAAEMITVESDKIRCTHPLVGSVSVELLPPSDRRALHARIAEAVVSPELIALHRSLATIGPDEVVATRLEGAARQRAQQGATARAAELAGLAFERTPDGESAARWRRGLLLASLLVKAGDLSEATRQIAELESIANDPAERVELLLLRSDISATTDDRAAAREAAVAALELAADDARLAARCHAVIATSTSLGVADELEHSRRVLDLVSPDEQPAAVALALSTILQAQIAAGDGVDAELFEQAMALDDQPSIRWIDRPSSALVTVPRTAGDLVTARQMQLDAIERARTEGDEAAIPFQLAQLAAIDLRNGDGAIAIAHLDEAEQSADMFDSALPPVVSYRVHALALSGRLREAELLARSEQERLGECPDRWLQILLNRPMALVALQRGDHDTAARLLLAARELAHEFGVVEPAYFAFDGDLVEALAAVDEVGRARRVVDELMHFAERGHLAWTRHIAARSDLIVGSTITGRGFDIDTAIARCIDEADGLTSTYERARTELAIGRALQRSGRRRDARVRLEQACDQFRSLGAPGFAAITERELERLGGRAADPSALTTSERQIAQLAAEGLTNREIATQLYISVRTVESHLSAVYRKLGLTSRKALIRRLSMPAPST
jgi:DNA-binding CsgD family transcriptional regulator